MSHNFPEWGSGILKAVDFDIPADSPRVGDRVTAYAPAWFANDFNDYGAFQKLVLVPSENSKR